MKLLHSLTMVAVIGLTLSACASSSSTKPMALPESNVPPECKTSCGQPPAIKPPRDVWELEMLVWGLECRQLHDNGCKKGLE